MSAKRSQVKKNAIAKASQGNPRFTEFADHVVNPSKKRALLAPSLCPSRAGAVTFPIVVDVTGMSEFAVIAQPDIEHPLLITHNRAIAESNDDIYGSAIKSLYGSGASIDAQRGCHSEPEAIAGRAGIALTSAAGCTVNVKFAIGDADAPAYDVHFYTFNGATWVDQGSGHVTRDFGETVVLSAVNYSSSMTHYAFAMYPAGAGIANNVAGTALGTYHLNLTSGTATCSDGTRESVFDSFAPEWEKVLEVADKISIPFMDCLLTYQGSTLDNQGAIAVCGCSEELTPIDGGYYQSIAQRPFDSYEGRLASQGETDGGAHWHLLHDDIRAYSLSKTEDLVTGPRGYFGIKGMDPDQITRVMVKITLNYYTIDPSFSMSFQPPWGSTDLLLHTLRVSVPLVSSNDSHLEKLYRLARRKASEAAKWALNNPEEAAAMAATGMAMLA